MAGKEELPNLASKKLSQEWASHRKDQGNANFIINPECDAGIGEPSTMQAGIEEDSVYYTAEEDFDEDGGALENIYVEDTPVIPNYLLNGGPDDAKYMEMTFEINNPVDELRCVEECIRDEDRSESEEATEFAHSTIAMEGNNTKNGEHLGFPSVAIQHPGYTVGGSEASVDIDERVQALPTARSLTRNFGIRSLMRSIRSKVVFQGNDAVENEGRLISEVKTVGNPKEGGSDIRILSAIENIQPTTPQHLEKYPVRKRNTKFTPDRWVVKSAFKLELETTGYSYEGEVASQKMHGFGCLILNDDKDFIWGTWADNRLIELQSCRLRYKGKTFIISKRPNDYLVSMCENNLVATVKINGTDQLDFNDSIIKLKNSFFKKLRALKTLQNEHLEKRQDSLGFFENLLMDMISVSAPPIVRANVFNLLKKYSSCANSMKDTNHNMIRDWDNSSLSNFISAPTVPPALKDAATILQLNDFEYYGVNNSFKFMSGQSVPVNLPSIMTNIYKDSLKKLREMLIDACPSGLPNLRSIIQKMDNSKIVYLTKADMDVLEQLASQPFSQQYRNWLEDLVEQLGQTLETLPANCDSSAIIPVMSPIIEFLIKSLWETIREIVEAADGHNYGSMLRREAGNWIIEEKISWPKDQNRNSLENGEPSSPKDVTLFYHRALEVQYKVIFEVLKNFLPKKNYSNVTKFNYNFHVLERESTQQQGELPRRFIGMSEGRLVWLYILDHTIHEVFKDDPKYQDVLKPCNSLLQAQVSLIEDSSAESIESFRILTHNTIKLVTSSASFVSVGSHQQDRIDAATNEVETLLQRISTAFRDINHDQSAFSNFRNLVVEYNNYFALRHVIEVAAAPGYFSAQLKHMMKTFICIVEASLKKSVTITDLVAYFRCLNDFIDDFRCIDFLSMWYVKNTGFGDQESIAKIDNKLGGKNCSYRVTNVESFVAEYERLDIPTPHHYIIQIVTALFECLDKCLHKEWLTDEDQLHSVQLKATGVLLDSIRRSFMYLKEQPDYVDFNVFKKESVGPFARLVEECSTLDELKTRANIVKESFWYLRKMDEIDVDQALFLLRDVNTDIASDEMLSCYNLYLSHYNKLIEEYTSVVAQCQGHTEGLTAVMKMLKPAHPHHFSEWNEQFKSEEIPVILAGASAVWSILISKDLSSTGKFLKPHCIQILCIFRLLSIGCSGTDNHLAQVLTGQGKSVILGLLSSVLALTGHDVRVMCYSQYLSSRDQKDFKEFFKKFLISDKIEYGTFKDMANDFLRPTVNGKRTSFRQMVVNKVRDHSNWSNVGCVTPSSKNTVLLIDEVDVFFTEHFYGGVYCSCDRLGFSGLAVVQENIWRLAKTNTPVQQIVDQIGALIRDMKAAGNAECSDLITFLGKPGKFSLLKDVGENIAVRDYTNQSLFDEHLLRMATDAVAVGTGPNSQWEFIISSDGLLCVKMRSSYQEEWTNSIIGYSSTFNYFRLKESDYDHKGYVNYGYFLLKTGNISYAQLPSEFRLILGVSGTLTNLSEYEKSGMKSYNIHNTTFLPSFYGDTHLTYDVEADFHYHATQENWLKCIYNSANKILPMNRAVLIFFTSDLTMSLFVETYRTKFDRLNEITPNTEPHLRDAYIEESGLPGAVTLATRIMGRGVDYKSSLSVEKNGGVHVIQTFYSTDIKEEVQIKGRTARKDNKGTYEMIICKEHLIKEKIIPNNDETTHTYATLSVIRAHVCTKKGETVNDRICCYERDHQTTMQYFGMTRKT